MKASLRRAPARLNLSAAVLAALFVLLTACGSGQSAPSTSSGTTARAPLSELEPVSDPRTHEGPSTATLQQSAVHPVADNPAQTLPVTVTSHDHSGDRRVTVKDTSRVLALSLSGSLAATVWGLGKGGTLVGRDQSTTFDEVRSLPVVTSGGHSVNAEAILATKPTLVITDGSVGPRDVLEQLRDVGVTVIFVKNTPSFAGAAQLVRDVAEIYGVPAVGNQLATRITRDVETTKHQVAALAPKDATKRPRMVFLYLRGNAGIYYLFGKGSGADELIAALGGVDAAKEQGWDGMKPMTDEAITKMNPDLILCMTDGLKSAGGVDGLLQAKPAIAVTNAGKHRRFVDMADGAVLSFGPRSAEVLDALARAVYAPGSK